MRRWLDYYSGCSGWGCYGTILPLLRPLLQTHLSATSEFAQQVDPAPRGGRKKKKKKKKGRRRNNQQGPSTPRLPLPLSTAFGRRSTSFGHSWEQTEWTTPSALFLSCWRLLDGSGRTEASAFLEYLRFRALVSVISSVKHNAQMALRWVRYLQYPI